MGPYGNVRDIFFYVDISYSYLTSSMRPKQWGGCQLEYLMPKPQLRLFCVNSISPKLIFQLDWSLKSNHCGKYFQKPVSYVLFIFLVCFLEYLSKYGISKYFAGNKIWICRERKNYVINVFVFRNIGDELRTYFNRYSIYSLKNRH